MAAPELGDLEWRLFKNDEIQDADFLMRGDALWFADYINSLETRAAEAEAKAKRYGNALESITGKHSFPSDAFHTEALRVARAALYPDALSPARGGGLDG